MRGSTRGSNRAALGRVDGQTDPAGAGEKPGVDGKKLAWPPIGATGVPTSTAESNGGADAPGVQKWPEVHIVEMGASPPGPVPADPAEGRTWAAIWAAVKVYYFIDAIWAFILAFVALIVSTVLKATMGDDGGCFYSGFTLAGSILVFITRCMDMCMGCIDVFTSGQERFGTYCYRNIILSAFQCFLGIFNAVFGGLAAGVCGTTWVSMAVGLLLLFTAAEEIYVWVLVYVLWKGSKSTPPPKWCDNMISKYFPDCLLAYIDRHK